MSPDVAKCLPGQSHLGLTTIALESRGERQNPVKALDGEPTPPLQKVDRLKPRLEGSKGSGLLNSR